MAKESERRAIRPDAQAFDAVNIVTVPRYKTSGLSGDEWRISARIEFWRKGKKIAERYVRNVEVACGFALAEYWRLQNDGQGYFAGEGDTCDQEGCDEAATVTLRIKQEFCKDGHASDPNRYDPRPLVRKFCSRHSRRGDCGLEDADSNYEVLAGSPTEPQTQDVKPSTFGGFIPADPNKCDA